MAGFLRAAAAAVMLGVGAIAPQAGQRALTIYARPAPEYDGLGRKKRRVEPTPSSDKRRSWEWRRYAERVLSTHRFLPDGTFQEDPRDDKYLHSAARWGRGFRKALAGVGR